MWKEKAVEMLRKKGYKMTPQRLKLIEVLNEIGSEHPSLNTFLRELERIFRPLASQRFIPIS
ncbi:iron(II) uptake regulation protein, frame shift [Thermococcus kodakarensis KOD1]|uniref:Iron(II) uptake regulation protein, frame shift n=1 Tax=Thermococcus kodakarensis (strain ATCC BAA-918 / JCM 12380 / KOD1) TaxID=69014 RepID=Q5JDY8_THEKO